MILLVIYLTLYWRHNDVLWHLQSLDYLFNRLFRRRSKKTPKLRVNGPYGGIQRSPVDSPYKGASEAENVSIWWRHEQTINWWHIYMCHSTLHLVILNALQWRHKDRDGVSNHRRLRCLLNCWFRPRSKKTSKFHVTGLCAGNSPVTGGFPAQKASYAENVSTWWRLHGFVASSNTYHQENALKVMSP